MLRRVGMSPYIRRLRALVGTDLLLIPSVAVLVWDRAGRLLLVRDRESQRWMTIGGAIEPDEAPDVAAVREAHEEVGITVALDALVGVFGGPRFRHVYPNGDRTSFVPVVYDAHIVDGSPEPDGDEVDLRSGSTRARSTHG